MPWKTLLRRIYDTQPERRHELHRNQAAYYIGNSFQLWKLLGDYEIGLVLIEAYYSHDPEVTADYVTERLGFMSDDTVRRKLQQMLGKGVVIRRKSGRTLFYRLTPEKAEAASALLRGEQSSVQPQNAANYP